VQKSQGKVIQYRNGHNTVDDYLTNYEAAIKGTVLWSEDIFSDMKKTYEDAFEQQREMYGSMGTMPLVGKDALVEYLINYRDSLKEMTDALNNSLN